MFVLVFDDDLSIVVSTPHCLLHSMKSKDLLSCRVMLYILSYKLVLDILKIYSPNRKWKKLGK